MRLGAPLLLVLMAAPAAADPATAVYNHACAWCHGKDGRGDGPAAFSIDKYLSPRPRDLTRGRFELRSTASGELPTDEDLLRTLEHGIPGYMPSFRGLTAGERRLEVTAVKRFYPGFASAHPTPVPLPEPPALDAAAVARGRQAYAAGGCASCHGERGHCDGPSPPEPKDETGLRIRPADLRYPARFKNGAEPVDAYPTPVTGLHGTPMPSYADAADDRGTLRDAAASSGSPPRRRRPARLPLLPRRAARQRELPGQVHPDRHRPLGARPADPGVPAHGRHRGRRRRLHGRLPRPAALQAARRHPARLRPAERLAVDPELTGAELRGRRGRRRPRRTTVPRRDAGARPCTSPA